jgi:ATP-dependent DNA ligase
MGKDHEGAGRTSRLATQVEALGKLSTEEVKILETGLRMRAEDTLAGLARMAGEARRSEVVTRITAEQAAHAADTAKAQKAFVDAGKIGRVIKAIKKQADPKLAVVVANQDGGQNI